MEARSTHSLRTWLIVAIVLVGVAGVFATYRIALAGYRQGLTEARLREIALVVRFHETSTGQPVEDISMVIAGLALEDARRGVRTLDTLTGGSYRVGDFIFAPAAWRAEPAREPLLGWTDAVDNYRVVVLRDGRTKTLSPSEWKKLQEAGITP